MKYLLGKPLWWALESIGVVGEESGLQTDDTRWWGDYVVFPLVERAADAVEKKQWTNLAAGPSGSLYTLDGFRREFGDVLAPSSRVMSESDAKVLVRYLERDRSVAVVEKDVCLILFPCA